jgi:hypothetical protein
LTRFTITTAGQAALTISGNDLDLAITPNGSRAEYSGNNGTQLFVRALDALEPVAIATGDTLRMPFVSPDGQWVGFADNTRTLQKVAISGGPAIPLTPLDGIRRGRDLGAGRHDRLRNRRFGHRLAAHLSQRRHADCLDSTGSCARRIQPPMA